MRGGGGWEVKLAPRACWHGRGNTPQTPTLWPRECAAEDTPGRRIRGRDRPMGCRGRCTWRVTECTGAPSGAQPVHEGWGRLGAAGGIKGTRRVQGGCTLSLPVAPCKLVHGSIAPITNRNRRIGEGTCRWKQRQVGVSEIIDLDENFQCIKAGGVWSDPAYFRLVLKERQAQLNPQNWVGWCPGSSLTNHSCTHPRAVWEWPMSANKVSFEIGSRPDHPRSYMYDCRRIPRRLGQALVVTWKLRGKIFERIITMTPGSILAQENISQR